MRLPLSQLSRGGWALVSLALGVLSGACGLSFENEAAPFANECTSDSDCTGSAVCVSATTRQLCAATQADLGEVFLEVQTTSSPGTTRMLLKNPILVLGAKSGGWVEDLPIELPSDVRFEASLTAPTAICAAQDGTVKVKVELRSADAPAGFDNVFAAQSQLVAGSHRVELPITAGAYHVYVAPERVEGCTLPPARFFPAALQIPDEVARIDFAPVAEEPSRLTGSLRVPQDQTLDGWLFEVVEPVFGKPVSEQVTLFAPPAGQTIIELDGRDGNGVPYYYTQNALLRLRSPDGRLTVHWALSAVDLDGDNAIDLDLRDLIATPMPITATVLDDAGNLLSLARVTIQSKSLTGSANQNANYRVIVDSDENGVVKVNLVPGTYAVTVVPSSSDMGMLFSEWVITADAGGSGIGFQLPAQPVLQGRAVSAAGEAIQFGSVSVLASQLSTSQYLSNVLDPPTLIPRQLVGELDAAGAFVLPVDAGTLDFSIQLQAETGYPWVVLPRLLVQKAEQQPRSDLGALTVPYPVVLTGRVGKQGTPAALALVRAWISVDAANSGGGALVQIGSAVTDAAGRFVLPLPPSVTRAP